MIHLISVYYLTFPPSVASASDICLLVKNYLAFHESLPSFGDKRFVSHDGYHQMWKQSMLAIKF